MGIIHLILEDHMEKNIEMKWALDYAVLFGLTTRNFLHMIVQRVRSRLLSVHPLFGIH